MAWKTARIGDLATIRHGFPFDGAFFTDKGEHVLLTPGNCYPEGGLKLRGEREKYYVGEIPDGYLLHAGDVLVVMTDLINSAPILGGSFVIPEDDRFLHNQRLGLVQILDPKSVDARFLYFLFNTYSYRAQVRGSASGATVRHTSPKRIQDCLVQIPNEITEQQRIADILSSYDDLIENNRRRIELLQESAQLFYREWFVQLRFPGHEHTKVIDGLPMGWVKRPLGQLTTKIGSGATPRGGEASYSDTGVPLIRSLNVYDDHFDADGLAFIGESQAAALNHVTVASRDILLNITGASVARCCMAPERYLPARVNQHVMILRVDPEEADPFFVHAAINSHERKLQLLSYSQKGATREALTKDMMADFEITIPADNLMRQFGEIAASSFLQRENLANQNEKLRLARQSLLPRLMNGELAV